MNEQSFNLLDDLISKYMNLDLSHSVYGIRVYSWMMAIALIMLEKGLDEQTVNDLLEHYPVIQRPIMKAILSDKKATDALVKTFYVAVKHNNENEE